ncbi:hypothetical protein J2T57_004118 [Natronocella acetinitrilica]|uniref:Phage holin family protein n=1 Tax=Natronocella acetinitrilica TaxID=414046 RepID=A0AAE3G784_9GAMM|nr:phage holin family protein [Natronocella acetinitrilica]MCP1676944.1 hypothetical protein [Natronocella acetinitrilica]
MHEKEQIAVDDTDRPVAKAPDDAGPPVTLGGQASSPESLNESIGRVTHELRELAHDYLELAVLETRLSFRSALTMVITAIVVAFVLAGAWMALMGSAVLALISIGLAPAFAMLVLAAANLLLALLGWLLIRHKSRSLGWPATQRALKPQPPVERTEVSK